MHEEETTVNTIFVLMKKYRTLKFVIKTLTHMSMSSNH